MNLFVLDLGFSGRSFAALIDQTKTTLANWTQGQAQPKNNLRFFLKKIFRNFFSLESFFIDLF